MDWQASMSLRKGTERSKLLLFAVLGIDVLATLALLPGNLTSDWRLVITIKVFILIKLVVSARCPILYLYEPQAYLIFVVIVKVTVVLLFVIIILPFESLSGKVVNGSGYDLSKTLRTPRPGFCREIFKVTHSILEILS